MKLIIQIPCLNEEETLPQTIKDLPSEIPGIDNIEYLVIDDGSTDRTVEVAREHGVHHILSLGTNRGLGIAFSAGIEKALSLGADIVVNTDADNQYRGADIPKLLTPILKNEADLVVGCRPIKNHPEFSRAKKILQMIGSWALRSISRTDVRDAASGFRAFSRNTCLKLFVHTRFSYCMETIIQAGNANLRVAAVDIRVNPRSRPSRLFRSIFQYLLKSGGTILMMFCLYRPGAFFAMLSSTLFLMAFGLGVRYSYLAFYLGEGVGRHIASLILLSIFAFWSVLFAALGIIGEITKVTRRVNEENLYLTRKQAQKDA
jgi:glycosyltransferase involved in cell wall biosynthesis